MCEIIKNQNYPLLAISPVDGRYRSKIEVLVGYFSELALIKYRIKIEILYLIELGEIGVVRDLTNKEIKLLNTIWQKFSLKDAEKVKQIEKKINHDVKACEYFLKNKLNNSALKDIINFIHFGLTSEDINNLAYSCLLTDFVKEIYWLKYRELVGKLSSLAKHYKSVAMMSRTHGQPASPTTLGKELAVFVYRLKKQQETFPNKLSGKLAGAVGNYNAHHIAYPKINWLKFSRKFISKLGLEPWLIVTQIEPHDRIAELFQAAIRINNILLDFCRDLWFYISLDYFRQISVKNEVGSSTMPHKVNPTDFENAEGNLGVANTLFTHFSEKLPISRLQRDLSDSTVQRCLGVAFGHTILSFISIIKGLSKINADEAKIKQDLSDHPELVAEAIQTILRREKQPFPYELLKDLTRGKKITHEALEKFIDKLAVSAKVKKELKKIKPQNYLGLSQKLTAMALK